MKKSSTQYSIQIEKRDPQVIETGPSKDERAKRRPIDMEPNSPNIWALLRIINSGRK